MILLLLERPIHCWLYVIVTLAWLNTGCVGTSDNKVPSAISEIHFAEELEVEQCLKEVLGMPTNSGLAEYNIGEWEPDLAKAEQISLETPLSIATDARRFSLLIDHDENLLFLVTSGGLADHLRETHGPWSTAAPKVIRLIQLARRHNVR